MMSTIKMYANKQHREQDGKDYFYNIFSDFRGTFMSTAIGEKIFQIKVREALTEEETPYYGWKYPDGNISMIFPSTVLLEICFPYGIKAAIDNGEGNIVKLIITEIDDELNFCGDITPEDKKIIIDLFSEIKKRHTSIRSLLNRAYEASNEDILNTTSTIVNIGKFKVKIAHKNARKSIQLITIDGEIECYYIGFKGRHWFFKDERRYHSIIKTMIYGKGGVS